MMTRALPHLNVAANSPAGCAAWLCSHSEFRTSKGQKALLLYLAEQAETQPERRLSQADIAYDVFDRGEQFDASIDAFVRVAISRLRKDLDLFYSSLPVPPAIRLEIPKGGYAVRIVQARNQAQFLSPANKHELVPKIAVAAFVSNDKFTEELAVLLDQEIRFYCYKSPIVRDRFLDIVLVNTNLRDDFIGKARELSADFVLSGQFFHIERKILFSASLISTQDSRLMWSDQHVADSEDLSPLTLAGLLARDLAAVISDPVAGIGPRLAAQTNPGSRLAAVMTGYRYIATQQIRHLGPALESLTFLTQQTRFSVTGNALLADMNRVAQLSGRVQNSIGAAGCMDLIETALCGDPSNATAKLAFGYAHLRNGDIDKAGRVAKEVLSSKVAGTFVSDARLLGILSGIDMEIAGIGSGNLLNKDGTHIFNMLCEITSLFLKQKYNCAHSLIDKFGNTDIFWIHLFGAAINCEIGDIKSARRHGQYLNRIAPFEHNSALFYISSFFPKKGDSIFIAENLYNSGYRIGSNS